MRGREARGVERKEAHLEELVDTAWTDGGHAPAEASIYGEVPHYRAGYGPKLARRAVSWREDGSRADGWTRTFARKYQASSKPNLILRTAAYQKCKLETTTDSKARE